MVQLSPLRLRVLACALCAVVGCAGRNVREVCPLPVAESFSASGEELMPDRWWIAFDDPQLDVLVNRGLGDNFDLAAALYRLQAARAVARREASDLLPDLNGVVDIDSRLGRGPDRTGTVWGLDAAYQVDLWGRIRSRVDAERLRAAATHADYHAVALALSAEIARTWYALIESRAQLELLEAQVETNRTGLRAQELRFGQGVVSSPDVLRQRQLVEATLESVVVVEARIEVLEHQLALLLGQQPQAASYPSGTLLPELPPMPSTGLPSELLARRPDVRRDFLLLQAADRDLAAAITDQYPRIDLTGSLLNAAETPDTLFRDWFLSIGGQVFAPLLDGGQRRAEVVRNRAIVRQRFSEYGQSMLVAFREVEDALTLESYQVQRIARLNEQLRLAGLSSNQLTGQYLIGADNYLDVLSANQVEQRLQRETLSARLELVLIRIGLYLALAGDFETSPQIAFEQPATSPATPTDMPRLPENLEELPAPVETAPEINIDE